MYRVRKQKHHQSVFSQMCTMFINFVVGSNCQTNIDDCQPNPCQNGGTCVDGVNGYNCTCTPTLMGKNCSKLYNACESFQPCMNGATCNAVLGTQNYSCNCVLGFTDANCSTNIDDCLPSACTLPLVCYDLINDYKCACPIGLYTNPLTLCLFLFLFVISSQNCCRIMHKFFFFFLHLSNYSIYWI